MRARDQLLDRQYLTHLSRRKPPTDDLGMLLTFPFGSVRSACYCRWAFVHLARRRAQAYLERSYQLSIRYCHRCSCPPAHVLAVGNARFHESEGAPEVDAVLQGKCSQTQKTYSHEAIQPCVHHRDKRIEVKNGGRIEAEEGSMVVVKVVVDMVQTGRKPTTTQVTRERAEWDRDTRNRWPHHQSLGDRQEERTRAAENRLVRPNFAVGEGEQDGETCHYGDVYDSLDLADEEVAEDPDHHRLRLGLLRKGLERNLEPSEVGNWDLVPVEVLGRAVDRVRHR